MGYDVTGRLLDCFVTAVIMFLIPVIWCAGGFMFLKQEYGCLITKNFVNEVCTMGSIRPETYEAYLYRMGCVGDVPKIEMTRTVNVYEPVYIGNECTGEVVSYESKAYTEQILSTMYEFGIYEFNRGDGFMVSYINSAGTYGAYECGTIDGTVADPVIVYGERSVTVNR